MNANPITIDSSLCTACGACAAVCPQGLFDFEAGELPRPSPETASTCIRCGHCVAVCPGEALRHGELDPDDFPPAPKPLDFQTLLGLLRTRRSVRAYDAQPVAEETVHQLLQAARYAPTGHKAQHVGCTAILDARSVSSLRSRIVSFYRSLASVVENPLGGWLACVVVGRDRVNEIREALPSFRRAAARLEKGGDPLFHGAPTLLLFHAPKGKETAEVDCALAASQVTLLAAGLDLGTCHIGYASAVLKRRPLLARAAGVPSGRTVFVVLTLGYPAFSYPRLVPRPPFQANLGGAADGGSPASKVERGSSTTGLLLPAL